MNLRATTLRCASRSPFAAAAVAMLAASALAAAAETEEAAALLRRLQAELQERRYGEALATARRAAARDLPYAALWYNLAGLEEMHGDRAAAQAALRRSVDLGFDDFRHADQDADIAGLRDDAGYGALRARWAQDLSARAAERALALAAGAWSASFALAERDASAEPPEVSVRLRGDKANLDLELLIAGYETTPRAPWLGGSGVHVMVGLPAAAGAAEGTYHVEFAFGTLEGGLPVGAVRLGGRWQRVAELAPQLRMDHDAGRLRMNIGIPWSLCGGLHPLVDTELGLNVTYVRQGGDRPRGRVAWLADPATGSAQRAWRRGVPVRWLWNPEAGPAVYGRLADLVVRHPHLDLAPLVVVARDERPVPVQVVLRDRHGKLVTQTTWSVAGPPGRRERNGSLPLALAVGSARLGVSYYDTAGGTAMTWQTDLVHLPPDWEQATAARIAALPAREQPTLRHIVTAIGDELSARAPRTSSVGLGLMVDEIEDLLETFATAGTTVPAGGDHLAVMPGERGAPDLRCSLSLPDGWRRGDPVRTLLLLARVDGGEQQAVARAPRLLAEIAGAKDTAPPAVVLAIPHLGERADAAGDAALLGEVVVWLRDFLGCGPIHLAGVDLLAATVLEIAAAQRDDLAGILMLTGLNFVPYPGDDPAALAARVAGLDPGLPAGWLWFAGEQSAGDQSAALRRGLREAGLRLAPARSLTGGLDFNQAWQRSLRWAVQPLP